VGQPCGNKAVNRCGRTGIDAQHMVELIFRNSGVLGVTHTDLRRHTHTHTMKLGFQFLLNRELGTTSTAIYILAFGECSRGVIHRMIVVCKTFQYELASFFLRRRGVHRVCAHSSNRRVFWRSIWLEATVLEIIARDDDYVAEQLATNQRRL